MDIEALGREQLRLIGVPEDELNGVSAEDAMAWCGRVLGFEHGAAINGAANCEAQGREKLRQIGVPEDELEGTSAEDAMAHVGQVLGFEHGAANLEAQGREMLRLIGVPEDELESASAEDAMAWYGMVLGFEHGAKGRGVTHVMDEETARNRGHFWWSPALIESFDAAIHELGGLKAATPAAILQKMPAAKSMSALTRTVVGWRLQHARRGPR